VPGPRQSLDDYVRDRIAQFHNLGGVARDGCFGTVDEGGEWATVHGWVTFGEYDAGLLGIFEDIAFGEDGTPHRSKYGYQCLYDQDILFRYDFDHVQHPEMPYHKHLPPDGRRVAWDRVTLQDVVEEFWPLVTERDDARRAEESPDS
jgi:Family of unknown function (DUF6516)